MIEAGIISVPLQFYAILWIIEDFILFVLPFLLAYKGYRWYLAVLVSFCCHVIFVILMYPRGLNYYIWGGVPPEEAYDPLIFILMLMTVSALIGSFIRKAGKKHGKEKKG